MFTLKHKFVLALLGVTLFNWTAAAAAISDAAALVAAVRDGAEGTTIEIAPGRYELDATLELKSGMTLKGAGMDKTILTHTASWKPSTKALPDPETRFDGLDTDAYLIRIRRDTKIRHFPTINHDPAAETAVSQNF
jgi:nitrous oxidase accessory protein